MDAQLQKDLTSHKSFGMIQAAPIVRRILADGTKASQMNSSVWSGLMGDAQNLDETADSPGQWMPRAANDSTLTPVRLVEGDCASIVAGQAPQTGPSST